MSFHGHTGAAWKNGKSPTYKSWDAMIQRCYNPNNQDYASYKEIGVDKRWHTFENFLADMGERPPGTTLDRYPDGEGDYEPGNCRWATKKEQNGNRISPRFWNRAT